MVERLSQRIGSDMARGIFGSVDLFEQMKTEQRKSKQKFNMGAGVSYTHLQGMSGELQRECQATTLRDSKGATVVTPVGASARNYGIMFNLRIGEAPEANDWRQRQHRATAVLESPFKKGDVLAIGTVCHEGREHRPVFLDGWHKVVGNTATANWTVSGDVD
jgi:hypothetical protein